MSLRGSGSYDEAPVRIYPADEDTESVFCRHRARLVAAVSATAVAVAVFCVATATLVWTGHIGRTTPAATDLISHYAVSDDSTDTGPAAGQYRADGDWPAAADDDVTSGLGVKQRDGDAASSRGEHRLLESLFSSRRSTSDDDWSSTERDVPRHPAPRRLDADDRTSPSSPGTDDLSAPKHRKRLMSDDWPQDVDDADARPVKRRPGLPRRGKIRRRQRAHSRRTDRRHGRRRNHGHTGRAASTFPPRSRSPARLPIDVAIRMVGSRRRRHHRHRARQGRRTTGVVLDSTRRRRRRSASKRRRRELSRAWRRRLLVGGQQRTSSGRMNVDERVGSSSRPSDGAETESTSTKLSDVHWRTRRSTSVFARSRLPRDMDRQRQRVVLEKLIEATMSDAERAIRNLTPSRLDELLGNANGTAAPNASGVEGPFWRVELSTEQKTFVAVVVVIAIIVAVGTLIFACVWCLLDQDGLCPPGWCSWLGRFGTPKDTFSPQRWWMEALAQRVENLEAGQPLMERKGRRKKGKKSRGDAAKAGKSGAGDEKKAKELTRKLGASESSKKGASKAVSAEGGTGQGTAGDNASDALFAGLADNKMLQ